MRRPRVRSGCCSGLPSGPGRSDARRGQRATQASADIGVLFVCRAHVLRHGLWHGLLLVSAALLRARHRFDEVWRRLAPRRARHARDNAPSEAVATRRAPSSHRFCRAQPAARTRARSTRRLALSSSRVLQRAARAVRRAHAARPLVNERGGVGQSERCFGKARLLLARATGYRRGAGENRGTSDKREERGREHSDSSSSSSSSNSKSDRARTHICCSGSGRRSARRCSSCAALTRDEASSPCVVRHWRRDGVGCASAGGAAAGSNRRTVALPRGAGAGVRDAVGAVLLLGALRGAEAQRRACGAAHGWGGPSSAPSARSRR